MSDSNRDRIRPVEGAKDDSAVEHRPAGSDARDKIGDFGKGSREQTQGGADPAGHS